MARGGARRTSTDGMHTANDPMHLVAASGTPISVITSVSGEYRTPNGVRYRLVPSSGSISSLSGEQSSTPYAGTAPPTYKYTISPVSGVSSGHCPVYMWSKKPAVFTYRLGATARGSSTLCSLVQQHIGGKDTIGGDAASSSLFIRSMTSAADGRVRRGIVLIYDRARLVFNEAIN